ncbi:MAG: hypothetical protein AMJ53_16475, partial [Gammaproteobacteria bacterium SG8_11]
RYWQRRYCFSQQFANVLQILTRDLYAGRSTNSLQVIQQGLLQQLQNPVKSRREWRFPHISPNLIWDVKNIFLR